MLTKTDLEAIGNLIDKKLSTDISAIQARIANMESSQVQKFDLLHLQVLIRSVEKRIAAVEGKLLKTASKDDLKNFATKVESNFRKLHKELKTITRFFDNEHIELEKRVTGLEKYKNRPSLGISS